MSTDLVLQSGAALLFLFLVLRQLSQRFTVRAGWALPVSWFIKYGLAAVPIVVILEVVWQFRVLPQIFEAPGAVSAISGSVLALVLMTIALIVVGRLVPDATCGCTDPDDDEETQAEQTRSTDSRKSPINPFQGAPKLVWSAEIAARSAGGLVVGMVVATAENVLFANGNWLILFFREVSVLPLYGAAGALLAWGTTKLQSGSFLTLGKAVLAALAVVSLYWIMVFGAYPLPFLSWFLAPPAFLAAWRFIGDLKVVKRPWNPWKKREKKAEKDCED